MSHFVPYVDRDAASQLAVLTPAPGSSIRSGVGKSFQSQSVQRPGFEKRKPLVPVNRQDVLSKGSKPMLKGNSVSRDSRDGLKPVTKKMADMCLKPPRPALNNQQNKRKSAKENKENSQESTKLIGCQTSAFSSDANSEDYPPIETIPVINEEEDNFEDIWAASERPDNRLDDMLSWRPSRIFPNRDDGENRDDLLPWEHDSSIDDVSLQDPIVEGIEYELAFEEPVDFPQLLDLSVLPSDDSFSSPSST